MSDDAAREQAFVAFLKAPAAGFVPTLIERRAAFDAVWDAGSAAAREQVAIQRELEQICWQSGYAAGVEHERAVVVAYIRGRRLFGRFGADWLADELEHGALDEVKDG